MEPMPLMLLLLASLLTAVVWGFFHANPKDARGAGLHCFNAAILAAAAGAAAAAALPLHADALARHPDQRFMAVYLAIMAGGSAWMLVLIAGGLLRNLVIFRRR
jgi:hypothetical protein